MDEVGRWSSDQDLLVIAIDGEKEHPNLEIGAKFCVQKVDQKLSKEIILRTIVIWLGVWNLKPVPTQTTKLCAIGFDP